MEAPRSNSWLKPLLKPLRPAFRDVALMSLFVNVLALALPVFILQVYDRVVFYQGLDTLYALVIGVAIAVFFDFVLRQARARLLQRAAVRIDAGLGEKLFDKLASLPLAVLESRPASYWHVLFRDVDTVRNVYCGSTAVLVADLPFVALFLVLVFIIAAPIAWVIVVAIPIFLLLAWRSGQVMKSVSGEERAAAMGRDALISEMLAGRATVKALALGDSFRPRWEEAHATTIERAHGRGAKGDGYVNAGLVMAALTTVALTGFGAVAIIDQRITIGALIATNMLSNRIISPFNQLVGAWRYYAQYRQAIKRLGEAFALPGERTESKLALERPQGELTLEDVRFCYDPQRPPVIDGVALKIKPGGMVGLVGNNGSGKTTLLKLMQGLYAPSEGRVLLDGADVGQFTRREIAGWIGYVPQESILFAGSIRDNIAIANSEADDDEIAAAARLAGAHDFIIDLPDGYATDVGEAGSRLSGGERQRIAIARALLRDPPALLLDEVTSNLDQPAQNALRETLVKLADDHTVVLVSHAPALLSACRHIVVLDRGRIRAAGPSREVLPRLMGGAPRPAAVQATKA
ncbi:MAG: peptidase domain-containing ABC transporter [Alphaproteobacteria bacterium]